MKSQNTIHAHSQQVSVKNLFIVISVQQKQQQWKKNIYRIYWEEK